MGKLVLPSPNLLVNPGIPNLAHGVAVANDPVGRFLVLGANAPGILGHDDRSDAHVVGHGSDASVLLFASRTERQDATHAILF